MAFISGQLFYVVSWKEFFKKLNIYIFFDGGNRFNSWKSASNGSSVSFPTWEFDETDLSIQDAKPVKYSPILAETISDIWLEISQISNQIRQRSCNLGCFCSPSPFSAGFNWIWLPPMDTCTFELLFLLSQWWVSSFTTRRLTLCVWVQIDLTQPMDIP